jgi:hypothetical protein
MTTGQKVFLVLGVGTLGIIVLPKLLAPKQAAGINIPGIGSLSLGSGGLSGLFGSPGGTPSTTAVQSGGSGIDAGSATDYSSFDPPAAGETYV